MENPNLKKPKPAFAGPAIPYSLGYKRKCEAFNKQLKKTRWAWLHLDLFVNDLFTLNKQVED